jgi:hypothetical protein
MGGQTSGTSQPMGQQPMGQQTQQPMQMWQNRQQYQQMPQQMPQQYQQMPQQGGFNNTKWGNPQQPTGQPIGGGIKGGGFGPPSGLNQPQQFGGK